MMLNFNNSIKESPPAFPQNHMYVVTILEFPSLTTYLLDSLTCLRIPCLC